VFSFTKLYLLDFTDKINVFFFIYLFVYLFIYLFRLSLCSVMVLENII